MEEEKKEILDEQINEDALKETKAPIEESIPKNEEQKAMDEEVDSEDQSEKSTEEAGLDMTFANKTKKAKKPKKSKGKIILIAFVSVLLLAAIGSFLLYASNTSAISSSSETVMFTVESGDTLDSISERLEAEGIIKSAFFAKIDAKLNGVEGFIVGNFLIDKSWDAVTILTYLTDVDHLEYTQISITFAEGLWAKDYAALIAENFDYTESEILALWNDDEFLTTCIEKYEFLDDSILNDYYYVKLEGYLFPETYYFDEDSTLEEITYRFLDQFAIEYEAIKDEVAASDFSLHEIVILASMVQYEANTVEDMKLVASVFYNRLAIDMVLQSSVTVCYALYDYESSTDCEVNTDIDSYYNTYMYVGLPIGPILNPGADALEAALNPAESNYYYFIADVNGDGTIYYSETYAEHAALQTELGLWN